MALVLVTSVTGYFVSKRLNSYGYRHREEEAAITKQINYQLKAVTKLEIAKDLRIFGMRPWINEVTEKVLAAMKAFHRQGLEISVAREVLDYLEIFRMEGGNPLAVELGAPHQICLEDVSCTYPGSENPVIAHINLTIHPGEKLAIAGLNGAGEDHPDQAYPRLSGSGFRQGAAGWGRHSPIQPAGLLQRLCHGFSGFFPAGRQHWGERSPISGGG